jgi:hypothetical protein
MFASREEQEEGGGVEEEVREMVDVRQFCSERLEFYKWLLFCNLVFFQNPSQMAGIPQTAVFCESCSNNTDSYVKRMEF